MLRRWTLQLAAIALVASGCVSPLMRSVPERGLVDDGGWSLVRGIDIPAVRGVEGCGAQALAAVLAFHDPGLDAATCAAALPWHDVGATPVDLLLEARAHGFPATIRSGALADLAALVSAGRPVLVMFDAAPEVRTLTARLPTSRVMHWGVVSGLAVDGSAVLVAARRARHHVIPWDEFAARWSVADHCAIVVEPRPGA